VEDVEKEIEEKEKEQKSIDSNTKDTCNDSSAEKDAEVEEKKDAKVDDMPTETLEILQADVEEDDTNTCMKLLLDGFLQSLPNCVNRELIDKVSQNIQLRNECQYHNMDIIDMVSKTVFIKGQIRARDTLCEVLLYIYCFDNNHQLNTVFTL
jgi:hypothetical protein